MHIVLLYSYTRMPGSTFLPTACIAYRNQSALCQLSGGSHWLTHWPLWTASGAGAARKRSCQEATARATEHVSKTIKRASPGNAVVGWVVTRTQRPYFDAVHPLNKWCTRWRWELGAAPTLG